MRVLSRRIGRYFDVAVCTALNTLSRTESRGVPSLKQGSYTRLRMST